MHIQARATPAASPADLAKFLGELAANRESDRDAINIEGVSGSAVEHGGKFVFTVTHGRARDCHDRLTAAGYHCEWTTDLYAERIPPEPGQLGAVIGVDEDANQPGVLLGVVQRAKAAQTDSDRKIDTLTIGSVTNEEGIYFIQVTFEDSDWRHVRPGDDD